MENNKAAIEMSSDMIRNLKQVRPDLFAPYTKPGMMRGLDVYNEQAFLRVFANALTGFAKFHKRFPDIINLPYTSDHYFKMKFFEFIPIDPNPASKIECARYIPESIADKIRIPRRYWISDSRTPSLPEDGELEPGIYWLKLEFGNSGHKKISWPPSVIERLQIDSTMKHSMGLRYGLDWGEWWYGIGSQRYFIEEDLSEVLENGTELKIYVGNNRECVAQFYKKTITKETKLEFVDEQGVHIDGSCISSSLKVLPWNFEKPRKFFEIMDCAKKIGQSFNHARVDLFISDKGDVYLGEITICTENCNRTYFPIELENYMRERLFSSK